MSNSTALKHVKMSTNKEAKASLLFMVLALVIGSVLFFFNHTFGEEYRWLFISPSYTGADSLTWINSSWGAVLSIHGTIAALSIAFMGMFIQQVAEASNKDFIFITRQLVLREYKFYQFSVDAISGLLLGLFFLVVGGGVVQYCMSMACSIYFILRYMVIFKHLYFITEKKEIIDTILLKKMKVVSEYVYDTNEKRKKLRSDYENCVEKYPSLITGYRMDFDTYQEVKLENPYFTGDKIITGFNELGLKKLHEHIQAQYEGKSVELFLYPSFYDSDFTKDVYIFHSINDTFDSFDSLAPLIKNCFKISDVSEDVYFFSEIESNIIQSAIFSLFSNNSKQLIFCIETLYLIIISSQELAVFQNLIRAISENPLAKTIPQKMLVKFYEGLIWKFYFDGREYDVEIFKSMLSLPRFIYDRDEYLSYVEISQDFIKNRVAYTQNYRFLGVYLSDVIKNLVYRQYGVFRINTDLLTQEFNILKTTQNNKLEKEQVYLIDANRTVIAYLSIRLQYIQSKHKGKLIELKDSVDEVDDISKILCSWLDPKYLQDIYYVSETYDVLFSKESMFLNSSDEFELKEVREGNVIAINVGYHRAVSLALLLFKSYSLNNSLSIIYIDNLQQFIKRNDLTTHFIEKVIDVVNSDYFIELIELIEFDGVKKELVNFESRKEDMLSVFSQLKSKIRQVVMMEVKSLPSSLELINKYEESLRTDFIKSLQEYVDLSSINNDVIQSGLDYSFQINKREILEPINGEFFSQSSGIYASRIMNNLIHRMTTDIEQKFIKVESIKHLNSLPEGVRYITINSLVEEIDNSFRFYRGMRYKNNNQKKPFDDNGFYYIALNSCYEFYGNKSNLLKVEFDEGNNDTLDNEEPKVNMSITLLLNWKPKKSQVVFFISAEDCKSSLVDEGGGR